MHNDYTKRLWQPCFTFIFCTNTKPVCDLCKEEVDTVIELMGVESGEIGCVCFNGERDCFQALWDLYFSSGSNEEYLMTRLIKFKPSPDGE